MIIIYNKYFPPKEFVAINIIGLVIARKEYGSLSLREINHEKIHTRQIYEMLVVPFYLAYLLEWFVRLIQYKDVRTAYRNISFEREAYENMFNLSFIKKRRPYAFVNYYKKRK